MVLSQGDKNCVLVWSVVRMSEGKILIVDDSESNAAVMAMHAEAEWDNPILTASSVPDAISILNQHQDIVTVISDYNMGDGNGGDLYEFIKKDKPTIPFILIAGDDIESFKENPIFADLFKEKPLLLSRSLLKETTF